MDKVIEKKKVTPKKIGIWSGLAIGAAFLLYSFYSTQGSSRLKVEAERLTIEKVTKGAFREFIPVTGTVMPVKTVYVDALEGGTVEEIYIEDGKEVKKGDPILKLSNQEVHMDAINREAQLLDQQNNMRSTRINMDQQTNRLHDELLQVEYQLVQVKKTYEANKLLIKDSLVSRNDYEKSQEEYHYLLGKRKLIIQNLRNDSLFRYNQVGQIESSLNLIHRNLQFLNGSLQNLIIRAPMSGQLSSLKAELGETKNKGENLAQIDQVEDFKVRAKVGEHYISRVFLEQEAEFKFNGSSYKLLIKKIYPEVTNGEFEVDMLFATEKPQGIRRGQTLQVKLALGDEAEALLLPRGGFYQETGGNWVYAIDPKTKTAYKKEVRLGRQNPDYYEVLEGLEAGQEVITSKYESFNNADELIIERK